VDLNTLLNFIQYNEGMVGANHPTRSDSLNRALKELVDLFNSGSADTQVHRLNIKIDSATDVDPSVEDDDFVYLNTTTGKYEKAFDNRAIGTIDVGNLIIYINGLYQFKTISGLVPNTFYYLSTITPGTLVDETNINRSANTVGIALASDKLLLNTVGGNISGTGSLPDIYGTKNYELGSDGTTSIWNPIRVNPQVLNENYTLPADANASVTGPFSIGDGFTLTISSGATFIMN
jgi:hypothetical protein